MSETYLRKGTFVLLVGIIGGYAADYIFNITLSRLLPTSEYGDYKVAYSFAFLLSVVVMLGGDRAALKYLSGPLSRNDSSGVWEFTRFYLLISLVLSALVVCTTLAASYFHLDIVDLEGHHPLVWMSMLIPLVAIGAIFSRVLQAGKYLADANWSWRLAFPLIKILLMLVVFFWLGDVVLIQVIACVAIALLVVLLWQWMRMRQLGLIELKRQPGTIQPRKLLKVSVPMMLAMLAGIAMSQSDLFMLELLSDEDHVGHYAAAAVTAHIVLLVQVTFTGLIAPLIAPAMEAGKEDEKALFWLAQKRITVVAIPLFVLLLLFSKPLMNVFDHGYVAGVNSMRILALAYLCWAMAAFSSIWLQYSGSGYKVVVISVFMLLINLLANFFLIPRYGLDGAASATLISMAIGSVALILAKFLERKGGRAV